MQSLSFDVTISPPASSFKRVLEMREREVQPDVSELVAFLETDPVTTAHLLRQVNSPEFTLHQNVASLERAVTMLGFDAVCNTVLTEWYIKKHPGVYVDEVRNAYAYVVRTSVASAAIAKELVRRTRIGDSNVVVTCALVHQLGRLALLANDPETYCRLWTESTTPRGGEVSLPPGIGRELVNYRTDYTRLGAEIAQKWELPSAVASANRFHSDPDKSEEPDRLIVMAVAASQIAARSLFEPPTSLDRDQGAVRVEKAYAEIARASGMLIADVEDFLAEVKFSVFDKAMSTGLHPHGPAQ